MSQQTICANCTRLFKRGIIRHTNVKKGTIMTDRELICVWRQCPMNNINVAYCNAFKKRPSILCNSKEGINLEGLSTNV